MTALAIQAPGVSAAAIRTGKVYPPNCLGLEGLFFFGGSVAESIVNRSPVAGKLDALALGSPGVGANYLLLKNQANYLQTQIAEVDDMTLIGWHTTEYLNFNVITNTWTLRQGGAGFSGNSYGAALYVGGGSSPATGKQYYASAGSRAAADQTSAGSRVSATHTEVVNGGAAGTYMTHAARISGTTVRHNTLTSGSATATNTIAAGSVRDKATGLLRLGSASVGGNEDEFRMCGAAIYSRSLTDAELSEFYAWLVPHEAARGLAV